MEGGGVTACIPLKHSSFDTYVFHKLKSRSLISCIICFQNLIVLFSRKNKSYAHNISQVGLVRISTNKSALIFETTTRTF
jgi:hypothetical protein